MTKPTTVASIHTYDRKHGTEMLKDLENFVRNRLGLENLVKRFWNDALMVGLEMSVEYLVKEQYGLVDADAVGEIESKIKAIRNIIKGERREFADLF